MMLFFGDLLPGKSSVEFRTGDQLAVCSDCAAMAFYDLANSGKAGAGAFISIA